MHNQTASTVILARSLLQSLDRKAPTTAIATATFELLLNTIVELGERDNPTARKIESNNAAFVASRIAGVER